MSPADRNLATARRWLLEVFNSHDVGAVPEIIADDYTNFGTTDLKGVEAGEAVITQSDQWAPDRQIDIIYEAAAEDLVFVLFTLSGTHTGTFVDIPPSDQPFSVYLADVFRFNEEGKMIEGWVIGKGDLKLALQKVS